MNLRNFLDRLQNLPDKQKKIIMWTIVAVLALVMGFFWVTGVINSLSKMNGEMGKIKIPQINIPNIPVLTPTPTITK